MSGSRTKGRTRVTAEVAQSMDDRTDWTRVEALTDEEIDEAARSDPDAQPTTAADWAAARRPNRGKESITIRLDKDVVEWFRAQSGPEGYQTRINAALREHLARKATVSSTDG
jgi:uncharacterized protein (DUF4415 family)